MTHQYDTAIPVLDHHCHICFAQPIEDSLRDYESLFSRLGIHRAALLACPDSSHAESGVDILENLKMLYLKERLSIPCYAYSGFTWHFDQPEGYAEFAGQMLQMGFDGFKSLTMHPRNRKLLGKGLNHPSFRKFFELADKTGSVMVCHVGDPRASWHLENPSEEMLRLGRVYDETNLTLDELYAEMEEVIARYRNMKFVLAHFYFISDNYERACRLLDEYPNVYLDLTPGGVMYVHFTKDPELWRGFFLKYSDRILLGSDHYAPGYGEIRYDLARSFLEGTQPFDYNGDTVVPFCLPREALDNIYWNNIHAMQPAHPRPLDRALIYEHCRYIADTRAHQLTETGRANLRVMTDFWKP